MRESLLDEPLKSALDSLIEGLTTVYAFPSTAGVPEP